MPASRRSRRRAPAAAARLPRWRWCAISSRSSATSGSATRSRARRGTTRTSARPAAASSSDSRRARSGRGETSLATIPVPDLQITRAFGPHLSANVRERTTDEPDRLVKTHCCFCGQQCGIQLKVKGNEVIGFEPWEDFPFNRGMLCPKGVKRYLQGSHPDRLLTALRRAPSPPAGFAPMPYEEGIRRVADEIGRIQK